MLQNQEASTTCYHCGDACLTESYSEDDHLFCCNGCKTVYSILKEGGLSDFYSKEGAIGTRASELETSSYSFLDEEVVKEKLLLFQDDTQAKVKLHLPAIHCSSCLWLLENLSRLEDSVIAVKVDFARRTALITYKSSEYSLKSLAELLHAIGYPPNITLADESPSKTRRSNKTLIIKLGLTGFLFGNIMLLSFPEYLSTGKDMLGQYNWFFSYLILALSLPVLLYSASDYYRSSWAALKQAKLTIDVPITIGILVIFFRSLYEIVSGIGPGYLDSMTGLVFFLLIGRWYQSKVYNQLAFDRDFRSYFPLSVLKHVGEELVDVPVMNLETKDEIQILSQGIIPADCELLSDSVVVDYSFVTGESVPVQLKKGDNIYAGGRNVGGSVRMQVTKQVSQSYLTELWNQEAFSKEYKGLSTILDELSARFTAIVLSIAAATALYWWMVDSTVLINAVTSVLIIACPCALALSVPFAVGNARRLMGKSGLYAKNAQVIEELSKVDTIVFDKTGTLTNKTALNCSYEGEALTDYEKTIVGSLGFQSGHPHSRIIFETLGSHLVEVNAFEESQGAGIRGQVAGQEIKLGSRTYVGVSGSSSEASESWISIDGKVKGRFIMKRELRPGIAELIKRLRKNYQIFMLSGDNTAEESMLAPLFSKDEMLFNQSPHDKLEFVKALQAKGHSVLMTGDGLNDAGALKQSEVGIAIAEDINQFTPACDIIMDAGELKKLEGYISYSKKAIQVVKWGIALSVCYNVVGISFAVKGVLTPLVAAILMPLSSVSIVVFATLMTSFYFNRVPTVSVSDYNISLMRKKESLKAESILET